MRYYTVYWLRNLLGVTGVDFSEDGPQAASLGSLPEGRYRNGGLIHKISPFATFCREAECTPDMVNIDVYSEP